MYIGREFDHTTSPPTTECPHLFAYLQFDSKSSAASGLAVRRAFILLLYVPHDLTRTEEHRNKLSLCARQLVHDQNTNAAQMDNESLS